MKWIYLHGFASGPGSTKARFFQERFRELGHDLLVPDLAAGDFENLTITGQLQIVEALAGGAPATLMGSSMGGYLAALFASRHPEVERVVLMAPAFGFTRRWPESLGPEKMDTWKRTGSLEVFHYGEKRTRSVRYTLLEDGARYEDYPAVSQPALVFHGSSDTVVPAALSEEFGRRRPNARVEILNAGHEMTEVVEYMWEETRRFLKL